MKNKKNLLEVLKSPKIDCRNYPELICKECKFRIDKENTLEFICTLRKKLAEPVTRKILFK